MSVDPMAEPPFNDSDSPLMADEMSPPGDDTLPLEMIAVGGEAALVPVAGKPFFGSAVESSWTVFKGVTETVGGWGGAAAGVAREQLCNALIVAIRQVADERDRSEIVAWFTNAGTVLSSGQSQAKIAADLYGSIDTLRAGQLVANMLVTAARSYQQANVPLALKVAVPLTAVGAGVLGWKGVGIAGFGSAIGMPVVVLLFLGSAGVASVVEAFVREPALRDPLARLVMAFVALERARRLHKEFLDALRADAMVPAKADTPETADAAGLLAFLLAMDPVAFERHVMSFFTKAGHPVGLTPRSNDFGVDGYVVHPDGVVVVQCKRYGLDNPVGRPAVQQFKGVVEEQKALRGYLVTTSRFTAEAAASAAQSSRLILIDGTALLGWHAEPIDPLTITPSKPVAEPHEVA